MFNLSLQAFLKKDKTLINPTKGEKKERKQGRQIIKRKQGGRNSTKYINFLNKGK